MLAYLEANDFEKVGELTEAMRLIFLQTKSQGRTTGYAQIYGKYNTTAYDKLKLD